jgi:hypothetical protein
LAVELRLAETRAQPALHLEQEVRRRAEPVQVLRERWVSGPRERPVMAVLRPPGQLAPRALRQPQAESRPLERLSGEQRALEPQA